MVCVLIKAILQFCHSVFLWRDNGILGFTVMCLSIGTPKNNKFSIFSKWKIYHF